MFEEVKEAIEDIATTFEEYKKTNDARLKAIEKGKATGELDAKLHKIELDIQKASTQKTKLEQEIELHKSRIEDLEARSKLPGNTAIEKVRGEYKQAFNSWVRNKGQSAPDEAKMNDLQRKALELKDVTIGVPAAGGYAVPEEISREIERLELLYSPVRSLVKVVPVGTSDYKELVNIRGANSGWVGETGSRTGTAEPLLRERAPTHGELYAYPQASEWSLEDMFFNVEQWLANEVADAFARDESEAVIRGDGTNKPTGLINTAPVATADTASPMRAPAAFEFIPCLTELSPAVAQLRMDPLIDTVYKLNSAYRAGAHWAMNSNTTGAVRKMKDLDGQYLWQPGLQLGQPANLLGYPVATWEQMDDIGTNKYPIFFGNFRRAYVLTQRTGLKITRDNVTAVGFVKFYLRRREGGTILNNDALKIVKTTIA